MTPHADGRVRVRMCALCTVLVLRMAHRIWKETKQEPGTDGPGNKLGCCLVSFHFLWAILSTCTVYTNFDQKCHFKGIHLPSTLCPETENRWQPHCNGNSIHFLRSSCRSYSTKKRQRSFSAECNPIVCWRRQFNATMALIKSGENFTSLEFSCK